MRFAVFSAFMAIATILAQPTIAAAAPAATEIETDIAPPEPVFEVEPRARKGFIRTPGYWSWTRGRYTWMPGKWVPDHKGYLWTPDSWEQRGNKWHFVPGHWDVDPEAAEKAASASEPVIIPPVDHDLLEIETDTANHEHDAASTAAEPAPAPAAVTKAKKRVVRPKKIDYNDTKKWPRYRHH